MVKDGSVKLDLIRELQGIVGEDYVVYRQEDLIVYEYDGSADKAMPAIVVIPDTAEQVAEIVQLARLNDVPIVARGAGTGLSGGAVAQMGGIVIALTRMTRILEVDVEKPHRGRGAGRHQSAPDRASISIWALLCARPFQPEGLYYWR